MEHKARSWLRVPPFASSAGPLDGATLGKAATGFLTGLRRRVRPAVAPGPALPVIYNANSVPEDRHHKRALLVYLVKSFLLAESDPEFLTHQNLRQCRQIAAILGEFGYVVDVAEKRNFSLVEKRDYEVIISDRADLAGVGEFFDSAVVKVFLATSMDYALHNQNVRERHASLLKRRNVQIQIRRRYPEAMPYLRQAQVVTGFGNDFIMSSWSGRFSGPLYPFNNYGFANTPRGDRGKDYGAARRNFLFFASRSQMQKGLDLLLEVFPKHPDLHLYVCSQFEDEADFCAAYRKELFETSNVHPIGWIAVNGGSYNELVRKCAFVIHPTCSEGQPGSVVQCMYSGLIPIVTRWAGIDTDDFGVTLRDDSLEEIERVVHEVSALPEEWHRERSRKTRLAAETKYGEDAFRQRWREILGAILAARR